MSQDGDGVKVLLSGFSGFVGGTLCTGLRQMEGVELRTVGRQKPGHIPHYQAELSILGSLEGLIAEHIDVVIHAVKDNNRGNGHKLDLPIFRFVVERGLPLLYFSSIHDHPSQYIIGKRLSERWLLENHSRTTILRIGHAFGPNHPRNYLRRRISTLARGFPFCLNPRFATGYTYIKDICQFGKKWILSEDYRPIAIEISKEVTNEELDRVICMALGRRPPLPVDLDFLGLPSRLKREVAANTRRWSWLNFCAPDIPPRAPALPKQVCIESEVIEGIAELALHYYPDRR